MAPGPISGVRRARRPLRARARARARELQFSRKLCDARSRGAAAAHGASPERLAALNAAACRPRRAHGHAGIRGAGGGPGALARGQTTSVPGGSGGMGSGVDLGVTPERGAREVEAAQRLQRCALVFFALTEGRIGGADAETVTGRACICWQCGHCGSLAPRRGRGPPAGRGVRAVVLRGGGTWPQWLGAGQSLHGTGSAKFRRESAKFSPSSARLGPSSIKLGRTLARFGPTPAEIRRRSAKLGRCEGVATVCMAQSILSHDASRDREALRTAARPVSERTPAVGPPTLCPDDRASSCTWFIPTKLGRDSTNLDPCLI